MEDQLLKRRISTPRAATVVVLAAVVAFATTVAPSLAGSFLTSQRAAKVYVSNKKANTVFLKKKAAANLYVAKKAAPISPVAGIAAGSAQFGPVSATTSGYIPTAFTSFATKATASSAVVTFSGTATCTSEKASSADACPVEILVDGQKTGKINFAPATLASQTPAALVHTIMLTTVLTKGGHTVQVSYAGAKNVTFTLKSWNLAVQAYPQPEEEEVSAGSGK
ncbi:MAG: hypothetical protein ACM3NV_08610 [Syntrophothermus sp.]